MIEESLYKDIISNIPILCVDVVLWHEDMIILIKRTSEPFKGVYWVIGGRVKKNETLANAAIRKIKEETNLDVNRVNMIGIYEDEYDESAFGKIEGKYHTVAVVFHAKIDDISNFKLDDTSNDWGLFEDLPERFKVRRF